MPPDSSRNTCPLCRSADSRRFHRGRRREYRRCPACHLVFVPPHQFVTAAEEKAEYDLHRNDPHDEGYRRFLGRLFHPMAKRLPAARCGLDFGCGPGPALPVMFEEIGHAVAVYDRFYADDPTVFERRYDFITATEVVEHLREPALELDRLWALLKPGGTLGIMTKLVLDQEAFSRWHYKNDPTHICFFSRPTFAWLAARWRAELVFADRDVILFGKNAQRPRTSAR